jgi:thiamine monophosphate kinase
LTALAGARSQEDLDRALTGGEDFELVISAPPNAVGSLAAEFFSTFGLAITRVGEVAVGTGLALTGGPGGERPLAPGGWDHVRGPLGGPAG